MTEPSLTSAVIGPPAQLLAGVRVLEFGVINQAPMAAMALSELGADVVKLESTHTSDPIRGNREAWGVELPYGPVNLAFESMNRGKRAIRLNLASERGRDLLHQLVAQVDVFVHNRLDPVVRKLEIDYQTLRAHNPRLVYMSTNGFGSRGPFAEAPGMDPLGCAMSGLNYLATAEGGEPQYPVGGICDAAGALMGVVAVLSALMQRERTGEGIEVSTSQLGAMMWLESFAVIGAATRGKGMSRAKHEEERNPLFIHYRCRDGKYVALGEWQPDRRPGLVYEALGRPDLIDDDRFNTGDALMANSAELIRIMDELFASRDAEAWLKAFGARGLLIAPVNDVVSAVSEEQVLANAYIQEYPSAAGPIKAAALPISVDGQALPIESAAPGWGENTQEILAEFCGLDDVQIAQLYGDGVI